MAGVEACRPALRFLLCFSDLEPGYGGSKQSGEWTAGLGVALGLPVAFSRRLPPWSAVLPKLLLGLTQPESVGSCCMRAREENATAVV